MMSAFSVSSVIWTRAALLLSLVHAALTVPVKDSNTTSSPCARVSAAYANSRSRVAPSLAYDCLNSVPLHAEEATSLVNSLIPYINWQSTSAYLADPPSGYLLDGVDLYGELDNILSNLATDFYPNEYSFGLAVRNVFTQAHDGHFRFTPDITAKAFYFERSFSLVSVSIDGTSTPDIYVAGDIVKYYGRSRSTNSTLSPPSPVLTIDGEDAISYLEDFSLNDVLQDPDALFNNVLYSPAFQLQGSGNIFFNLGYNYPSDQTVLGFANDTTKTYRNYAAIQVNFTGVTDGESFYEKFCSGESSGSSDAATTSAAATGAETAANAGGIAELIMKGFDGVDAQAATTGFTAATATVTSLAPSSTKYATVVGYPTPIISHSEGDIAGYFLEDPDHDDVAVLSVLSFQGRGHGGIPEFQQVAETFFAASKAAGKSKLVIDLSANGGGTIFLGYDLFKQLFPQPEYVPYGESRFRAHDALNILGQVYSEQAAALPVDPNNVTYEKTEGNNPFVYFADLDPALRQYDSWAEVYGPHEFHGDNFSSILRYNISDPGTLLDYAPGINITGYENRTGFTQPFAQKDIIMIYDGYCASTCTLFSEFMRTQAGIQSIAFGGRPSRDPIQAIGGTKGANDYPFSYVLGLAQTALASVDATQQAIYNRTDLGALSDLPLRRAANGDGSLNVRDNIVPGDVDQVPAQFIYEEADCRLYYTPQMVVDVEQMWSAAADATWGGRACVAGSGLGRR